MEKKVRFEEVARGKLIDIAVGSVEGKRAAKPVLPRKKAPRGSFFENKIVFENTEHLSPVRMRRKRQFISFNAKPSTPKSQDARAGGGNYETTPPLMPVSLTEQRIVYPEPAVKPSAPALFRYRWSDTQAGWTIGRSPLGWVVDKIRR